MKPKTVFISYSRTDSATAHKLKTALEQRAFTVAIDDGFIEAGANIQQAIEAAIRTADVMLSLVSNRSLVSAWVALESITAFYSEKLASEKKFIACYLDEDFFKIDFRLKATKQIDAQIDEIDQLIPEYIIEKLDTNDLNDQKTRLYELRNNLGKILQKLTESLTLDIRDAEYDRSLAHIIRTIEDMISHGSEGKLPHSEPRQPQLGIPELLQALANPDPLICFPAAKALTGCSDLGAQIIDTSGAGHVVGEAVRTVLGSFPEQSAELLVTAIRDCGITGETWGRASRASTYFTPAHRKYAEKAVVDFLLRHDVEVKRHALMALGQMGCLHFYTPELDRVCKARDNYQKCFSYALDGSACDFALAEEDYSIKLASDLLLHLVELSEKNGVHLIGYLRPLEKCTIRHIDIILTTWLETDSHNVQTLGLQVLHRLRLTRTAGTILKFLQKHKGNNIARRGSGGTLAYW